MLDPVLGTTEAAVNKADIELALAGKHILLRKRDTEQATTRMRTSFQEDASAVM